MTDTHLYTIPELAEYLTCSRPHIYALISSGQLQGVNISVPGSSRTKLRVRSADLEAFLEGSRTSIPSNGINGKGPARKEKSAPGHAT